MKSDTYILAALTVAVMLCAWLTWRNFELSTRAGQAESSELQAWKIVQELRSGKAQGWEVAE